MKRIILNKLTTRNIEMKCSMYSCDNKGTIKAEWFDGIVVNVCPKCFEYHKKHGAIVKRLTE